jgi:CBS domain-containing protein/ribosome-associated translation inhibitor RaiA
MSRAHDISATEVMDEEPFTVSSEKSISQIRDSMEEKNLRAVTVVDDKNRLKGAISYRDLIRHVQFNPDKTKLEKIMHTPPEFEASDSLIDLAELRINSGRKLLVAKEGKKLKGMIGDEQFRSALLKTDEIKNFSTRDLATYEVISAYEDDSIEKVRHKLLDNNISRVPILDDNGNLVGVLSSTDVLRTMITRQGQNSGGTSGNSLDDTKIAGGNEKQEMSDVEVSAIMNRTPTTHEGHFDGKEAIELMQNRGSHEVIIVDEKYPEAVITVKDFIRELTNLEMGNAILVNLVGLEMAEEKAAVHDKIKTQIQGSLGRKLDNPDEISLHVKKAEKDGKKHRYEVTLKLFSDLGNFTVNEEAWDLLEVVDSVLEEMNTVVRKKKEKRKEHRR